MSRAVWTVRTAGASSKVGGRNCTVTVSSNRGHSGGAATSVEAHCRRGHGAQSPCIEDRGPAGHRRVVPGCHRAELGRTVTHRGDGRDGGGEGKARYERGNIAGRLTSRQKSELHRILVALERCHGR